LCRVKITQGGQIFKPIGSIQSTNSCPAILAVDAIEGTELIAYRRNIQA